MPRAKHRSDRRFKSDPNLRFPATSAHRDLATIKPRNEYKPPAWLVKGVKVHYSSVIGYPPTKTDAIVLENPFQVNGGTWVTLIDKVRGWVACEALSQAVP